MSECLLRYAENCCGWNVVIVEYCDSGIFVQQSGGHLSVYAGRGTVSCGTTSSSLLVSGAEVVVLLVLLLFTIYNNI